jgi:hypothetical protein
LCTTVPVYISVTATSSVYVERGDFGSFSLIACSDPALGILGRVFT